MIRGFRSDDLKSFMNKILEGMQLAARVDHMETRPVDKEYLKFSGAGFTLLAELRDFGIGDIGFSRLSICGVGENAVSCVHQDEMGPSLVPRKDDFLRFYASQVGELGAKRKLLFVDSIGGLKLRDEPQVVFNGEVFPLSEFVLPDRQGYSNDLSKM